jgi:hypothetical protein
VRVFLRENYEILEENRVFISSTLWLLSFFKGGHGGVILFYVANMAIVYVNLQRKCGKLFLEGGFMTRRLLLLLEILAV